MNKCKGCQWYGKPYWSIINPCDHCLRETVEGNVVVFKEYIDKSLDIVEKDKEIDRLNNIINETRRILGEYAHYLTPTEEQNAKNEAIVDEAYNQLHDNIAKELKEENK